MVITAVSITCAFLILLAFQGEAIAQEFYFDVRDSVIELNALDNWVIVQFDTNAGALSQQQFLSSHPCLDDTLPPTDWGRGFSQYGLADGCVFDSVCNELASDPAVARVFRSYGPVGGEGSAAVTDLIYVRFVPELSFDSCISVLSELELEFVDSIGLGYSLMLAAIPDTESVGPLDYANALHVLPEVRWASPVLCTEYRFSSLPGDPYFQNQYYLHNTGQFGGTAGFDIGMDSAWMMPLADSNVIVAIIDDGLEAHADLSVDRHLADSDFVGQFSSSLSPDNDATPGDKRFHGMACAGIIAAAHNSIGVAGVHGGCRILAIKISSDNGQIPKPPLGDIAIRNAINYADAMGADVISCSWTMGNLIVPIVQEAILEAMALDNTLCDSVYDVPGVFVFAAGNDADVGEPWIKFPGSMPEVITVGAINNGGVRWGYSCFGQGLSVMAPTGDDNEYYWKPGDQWTLDREGSFGWNPANAGEWEDPCTDVDYTGRMGGTSGACPQVAGIVALLLSKRPGLQNVDGQFCDHTWSEVAKEIICSTTIDIGSQGYDEATGHGIANAFRALLSISRGDLDNSGSIDVLDVTRIINIAFRGGSATTNAWHPALADARCDGVFDVLDVTAVINIAFRAGYLPGPCYDFGY